MKIAKSILSQELGTDDELMLCNTDKGDVHILNPTARLVYELHSQGKNIDAIAVAVRKKFRVPADKNVYADVAACLEELRKKKVI